MGREGGKGRLEKEGYRQVGKKIKEGGKVGRERGR